MLTFNEIITANHGEPIEVAAMDEGMNVIASCWTDDKEVMSHPAWFNVTADWQITRHSPVSGAALDALRDAIIARVGGDWQYNMLDHTFEQVEV